jgi:hypothetical protein
MRLATSGSARVRSVARARSARSSPFEPEQDAMAVGRAVGTDQIRVLLMVPAVQLEDKGLSTDESVIEETVGMVGVAPRMHPQQGLVPGAAGLHVPDRDQCLRPDYRSSRSSHEDSEERKARRSRAPLTLSSEIVNRPLGTSDQRHPEP